MFKITNKDTIWEIISRPQEWQNLWVEPVYAANYINSLDYIINDKIDESDYNKYFAFINNHNKLLLMIDPVIVGKTIKAIFLNIKGHITKQQLLDFINSNN